MNDQKKPGREYLPAEVSVPLVIGFAVLPLIWGVGVWHASELTASYELPGPIRRGPLETWLIPGRLAGYAALGGLWFATLAVVTWPIGATRTWWLRSLRVSVREYGHYVFILMNGFGAAIVAYKVEANSPSVGGTQFWWVLWINLATGALFAFIYDVVKHQFDRVEQLGEALQLLGSPRNTDDSLQEHDDGEPNDDENAESRAETR